MNRDRSIIASLEAEFAQVRIGAEKAIAQLDAELIRARLDLESNSVAVNMKHLAGNFRSRFTNFLTEDGEKPWRARDQEFIDDFAAGAAGRDAVLAHWNEGWKVVVTALGALSDADLARTVRIRGEALPVTRALVRALAHAAYHQGQIVFVARQLVGPKEWKTISIARGASDAFNLGLGYDTRPAPRSR